MYHNSRGLGKSAKLRIIILGARKEGGGSWLLFHYSPTALVFKQLQLAKPNEVKLELSLQLSRTCSHAEYFKMNQEDLNELICGILFEYKYEVPNQGSCIGTPWDSERIYSYVELLKASLVQPYIQQFELAETYGQCISSVKEYADYWVVVEKGICLEWFDPATQEFGLGERGVEGSLPCSIGVRGDLVGVFCAM